MNSDIKEFDLNDAITRTAANTTGLLRKEVEAVVRQFLQETANGLAEHGRVEFHNFFSITLKVRKPRKGVFQGQAWETPTRVEPEFQAAKPLRELISQKQGLECI